MDDIEIEDDEDEMDGDHNDYESTDSMTSANQLAPGFIMSPPKIETEVKSPFLLQRKSMTSNAGFHTAKPSLSHQNSQQVCKTYIFDICPVSL